MVHIALSDDAEENARRQHHALRRAYDTAVAQAYARGLWDGRLQVSQWGLRVLMHFFNRSDPQPEQYDLGTHELMDT